MNHTIELSLDDMQEITVKSLQAYYEDLLMGDSEEEKEVREAIKRVLKDYMWYEDWIKWSDLVP